MNKRVQLRSRPSSDPSSKPNSKPRTWAPEPSKRILRKLGLRRTGGRLKILDLLSSSSVPLTAQEVHEKILPDFSVDRVSVYRILATFKKAGLIHQVSEKGYIACSHPGESEDAHLYLVCEGCDSVEEINWPMGLKESIQCQVLRPSEFSGTGPIQIAGLCAKCR